MARGERLDPPENPKLDAAWEHHMETCEYCLFLEEHQREPEGDCQNCDHPWHDGPCPKQETDGSWACDCMVASGLSERQVGDLQNKHFQDEQKGVAEAAAEAKYQAWRDRE